MTENDSNLNKLDEIQDFGDLEEIVEPSSGDGPGAPRVSVEESEPEPQPQQVDYSAQIFQRMFTGMPAPFFNPNSPKEYYRFLFGGVLMVLGCLMPFDADWAHVGYKSMAGSCTFLIGLGVVWSAWAAINTGLFRMKWVLLAFFPLVWSLIHLITDGPFMISNGEFGWQEFLDMWTDSEAEGRFHQMGDFLQHMGPGKIFIFLGSFIVAFTFIMGFFGGVKKIKEQKAQRGAAGRRR